MASSHEAEAQDVATSDELVSEIKKDNQSTLEGAIFGVLYTLSKEKETEVKAVVLMKQMVEFSQLMLFIVNNPYWGFNINSKNKFWYWFGFFQIPNMLQVAGYTLWSATFYFLCCLLIGSLGLCTYTAYCFTTDNFPYVWPVKLLKLFVAVFFDLFYVSALDVFLVALACDISGPYEGHMYTFTSVECLGNPNYINGLISIVMSVLFMTIAFLLTISASNQNPLAPELLAAPDSLAVMYKFAADTVMTLVMSAIISWGKVTCLFLFAASVWVVYVYLIDMPCYFDFSNTMIVVMYGLMMWGATMATALVYDPRVLPWLYTNIGLYGAGFIALGCIAMCWGVQQGSRRRAMMFVNKYRFMQANDKILTAQALVDSLSGPALQFSSPADCVKLSRIVREVMNQPTRDQAYVMAADAILQAGMRQFPESAFLRIIYGNFLIEMLGDRQKGTDFLEQGRKLGPNIRERFMLFVRDRERKQSSLDGGSSGGAMDLVSYVEFQNNFSRAMEYHQAALVANRSFWELLVRTNISFADLSKKFYEMDEREKRADECYRLVLGKFPKSVKLLKAYSAFLDEVRNDMLGSKKLLLDAEKVESGGDGDESGEEGENEVNEKRDGVVVISSTGVITVVNDVLSQMFGYKNHNSLVGRNVSVLMPPPYNVQHNTYLRKYMATGKASILDVKQSLDAKHKKGHTFPVHVLVKKIESDGKVAFMGIMRESKEVVPEVVVSLNGRIIEVNESFEKFSGYSTAETANLLFSALICSSNVGSLPQAISAAASGKQVQAAFQLRTKGGSVHFISTSFKRRPGSDNLVCVVTPLDSSFGSIAINDTGQITAVNEFVSLIFGYTKAELMTMNIAELMPRPYARYHHGYLARFRRTGQGVVVGNNRGRGVTGLHKDGFLVNMHLVVTEIAKDDLDPAHKGSTGRHFYGRISLRSSLDPEENCTEVIIDEDGVIESAGESLEPNFEMDPDMVQGTWADEMLVWPDGSVVNVIDALATIFPHTRVAGQGRPTPKGRVNPGPPPVLNMILRGGSVEHPALSRVCVEAVAYPDGPAGHTKLQAWKASALEGVISVDRSGEIVQANLAAVLLFGYQEEELLGSHVSVLIPTKYGKTPEQRGSAWFNDEVARKLISKHVDAWHRDGTVFQIVLEVSEAEARHNTSGRAAFAARVIVRDETYQVGPGGAVSVHGSAHNTEQAEADPVRVAAHKAFLLHAEKHRKEMMERSSANGSTRRSSHRASSSHARGGLSEARRSQSRRVSVSRVVPPSLREVDEAEGGRRSSRVSFVAQQDPTGAAAAPAAEAVTESAGAAPPLSRSGKYAEFDPAVVARARRGHCVFFAAESDEEDEVDIPVRSAPGLHPPPPPPPPPQHRPSEQLPPSARDGSHRGAHSSPSVSSASGGAAASAPHPLPHGATGDAASCPFLASRGGAASTSASSSSAAAPPAAPASAGSSGCLFAEAMKGPAGKLPKKYERLLRASILEEKRRSLRMGGPGPYASSSGISASKTQSQRSQRKESVTLASLRGDSDSDSDELLPMPRAGMRLGPPSFRSGSDLDQHSPVSRGGTAGPVTEAAEGAQRIASRGRSLGRGVTMSSGVRGEGTDRGDGYDDEDDAGKHADDESSEKRSRFKQLTVLLRKFDSVGAVIRLVVHRVKVVTVIVALTYAVGFLVIFIHLSKIETGVERLFAAGLVVESAQSALTDAITVNALNRNKSIFATEDLLAASEALKSKASEVDSNLHGLYLGFGALEIDNQKLYDFLSTESVRLQVFAPNATTFTPPMRNYTATPWDAVRLWARYSRRLSGIVNFDLREFPFSDIGNCTNVPTYLNFIQANGPGALHGVLSAVLDLEGTFQLGVAQEVANIQMVVLIVASCVALLAAYIFRDLLAGVASSRIHLLTVFLIVPRQVTIDLAAKPTHLPWLEGDAEEEQTKRAGEEEDRRAELEGVAREDDTKEEAAKQDPQNGDQLTGSKRGDVLAAIMTWTRKRSTMDRRSDDDPSGALKRLPTNGGGGGPAPPAPRMSFENLVHRMSLDRLLSGGDKRGSTEAVMRPGDATEREKMVKEKAEEIVHRTGLGSFRGAALLASALVHTGARAVRRAITTPRAVTVAADGGEDDSSHNNYFQNPAAAAAASAADRAHEEAMRRRAQSDLGGMPRENPVFERQETIGSAGVASASALRAANAPSRLGGARVLITDPSLGVASFLTGSGSGEGFSPVAGGAGSGGGAGVGSGLTFGPRPPHLNTVTSGVNPRQLESASTFKTLEEPGTARAQGAWMQFDTGNNTIPRHQSSNWADAVFQEAMGEAGMGGPGGGGNAAAGRTLPNALSNKIVNMPTQGSTGFGGSMRGIFTSAANMVALQRVGSQAHKVALTTQTSGQMVFKATANFLSAMARSRLLSVQTDEHQHEDLKIQTGRRLDRMGATPYVFLAPLMAWVCVQAVVFGVCLLALKQLDGPIRDMNASAMEDALAARVRYFAAELVFGAQLGFPAAYLAAQRALLSSAVDALVASHTSIIRGNTTLGLPQGDLYSHPEVQTLLFDRACLRERVACYPSAKEKDGPHPWYWRTTSGLDTLLRQYVQAADNLGRDPDWLLSTGNEHFLFLWQAGANDLHDGLRKLVTVFHSEVEQKFVLVKVLLIAPLPAMLVLMFLFFRRMFLPWLQRAKKESSRVAELLAQLPKELNVETLLLEAMGQGKKKVEETQDDEAEAAPPRRMSMAGLTVPLPPLAAKSAKIRKQLSRKLTKQMTAIGSQARRMLEGGGWADDIHGDAGGDLRETEDSESVRPGNTRIARASGVGGPSTSFGATQSSSAGDKGSHRD